MTKKGYFIPKFPGILILIILSTIWISSQEGTANGLFASTAPTFVKINSPHKGQEVAIGKNVTLLGTSSYNATSDCQVSIIVDNTRPYQKAIPAGEGTDNYSKWKYMLEPAYTNLTEGTNRVTAKLACNSNPAFTKYYSINLTGVNEPLASTQKIGLTTNGTASPFFLPTPFSIASASSNSSNTTSALPVSVSNSSIIDPSSVQSSSSSTSSSDGGHSDTHHRTHHHTHHTNHSGGGSSDSGDHHISDSGGGSSDSGDHFFHGDGGAHGGF